jgi:hypothetical protein
MMNRLRVILPPDWALIAFVLAYLLFEGPVLYYEHQAGQRLNIVHPGVILARAAAYAYGVFRVRAFHPAQLPEYRAWLERTPWTVRKPLPGGPVHLSWGDILVFGALAAAVAGQGTPQVLAVISLGLIGHSLMLALALLATGPKAAGFLVAFGVGLAIRLWPDRTACLAAAVATQLVGRVGLRLALARFPWPDLPPAPQGEAALPTTCGWPFDQLQPNSPKRSSRGTLIAMSLLAGWYFLAAQAVFADFGFAGHMPHFVFVQFLMMMVLGRIIAYTEGYAPPISLWGRIRTFRWIIPGYDQIFVAPLCVVLIGMLAVDRFRPAFLSDEVALAGGLALAMMVATTAGPDLTRWRLTGRHRLVPSNTKKAGQELVKVG